MSKKQCPADVQTRDASRRDFMRKALAGSALLAGAPLAQAALSVAQGQVPGASGAPGAASAAGAAKPAPKLVPTRKLGKTGVEVSMINAGGGATSDPRFYDQAWAAGIRYFDSAEGYGGPGGNERAIGTWLHAHPERRKDVYLVSKDIPGEPKQLLTMIDTHLKNMQTDHLDAFFIHGIGGEYYDRATSLGWPKSKEVQSIAEQLKKSGKIKFFGFSCHDDALPQYLQAASESGFIDQIMLQYDAFMRPDDAVNKALDACHKAGIGLVAMKTLRPAILGRVPQQIPEFESLHLTTQQALLQAVWSDERISSICSQMTNATMLRINTDAAHKYSGPLKKAQLDALRETILASNPTYCPGCEGCREFALASGLPLRNLARFVSYYEMDGNVQAREMHRAAGIDMGALSKKNLAAASAACRYGVDYAALARKAGRYFAAA